MLYERISSMCRERGISIARLERECGFGNATIRGWANSSPSVANVQKVAAFFDISVDELITPAAECEEATAS